MITTKSLPIAIAGAVAAASLTGVGITATNSYNGCAVSSTPTVAQRLDSGRYNASVDSMPCLINKHAGSRIIAENGCFGPATDSAVRSFQQRKGLGMDGYVGHTQQGRRLRERPGRQALRLGATGPNSLDCSGLTFAAHKQVCKNIPRTASAQGTSGRRLSRASLQPGDLIVANNGSHVARYVGGGMMVHTVNPSRGVVKEKLDGSWHQNRGVCYVSYL